MMNQNNYTVGSLFAGVGGICLAFKQAGFDVKWANEFDKNACLTYRNNFPHELYEDDIHNLKEPKKLGKVDILTSGFPCQAFSVAGYRKGFKDNRGNLFFETARFIDELKPKAYLLENVKNLVGHDNGTTLSVIKSTLVDKLGYSFIPFILNSKDYGNIPQTRERIYILGFKDEAGLECIENKELHKLDSKKSDNSCTLNFNIPKPIKLTRTIHDLILKQKQDTKYYYTKVNKFYPHLEKEIVNKDTVYQWRRVYVRENKNNLCPTLTANMGTGGHNVPLIKDRYGIRKLTPRECFKFMGFPNTFKLSSKMANSHLYKQAGNSVVVPVVERIAEEINKALNVKYKNCRKIA